MLSGTYTQDQSAGAAINYDASPELGDRFLTWFAWVLAGYAFAGRGFAYLGFPPLYIGEITALFGLLALLTSGWASMVLRSLPGKVFAVLAIWGAIRTIPYVSTYGLDAPRDAMVWLYGTFSFIMAGLLIRRPIRLRLLLLRYRRFAVIYGSIIWLVYIIVRVGHESIPLLPGAELPIISVKEGDALVHVTGALALMTVGLMRAGWVPLLMMGLAWVLMGIGSRGGAISVLIPMTFVMMLRPVGARMVSRRLVGSLAVALILLLVLDPKIEVKGQREISMQQLWANMTSILSSADEEEEGLDRTKAWRLLWWGKIVDYTFNGPYFWNGKGFGVSLGESDGFGNSSKKHLLRSPHNAHLTMLARAGVPGLALWLLLHGSWFLLMLRGYFKAKRTKDYTWAGVFLTLSAYWMAFMINATFDVYLEGPMGGIWFWTIFGVGLAAQHIYRYAPQVLWDD